MVSTVRIEFEGLPPFKGTGPNAAGARQRQQDFKIQAQRAFDTWRTSGAGNAGVAFPWDPMLSTISLLVTYERGKGTNDAANIVGGVCDALQGVAYADDKQVRHILYAEKEVPSSADRLVVDVAALEPPRRSALQQDPTVTTPFGVPVDAPAGWDQRIDAAWSSRATASGSQLSGPRASIDAAGALGVKKLSVSTFKTLQGLLDASQLLHSRWGRQENTIIRL